MSPLDVLLPEVSRLLLLGGKLLVGESEETSYELVLLSSFVQETILTQKVITDRARSTNKNFLSINNSSL